MLNLRFTAGVGVGISLFWHRASHSAPKGCGLLFPFLSLLYLFVSFCIR